MKNNQPPASGTIAENRILHCKNKQMRSKLHT